MATVEDVLLPDIGDFSDVEIIEVLVSVGDRIEPEQSLLTLESDKASIEIPSPVSGTVKALKVGVGDRVSEGAPLMTVETNGVGAGGPEPTSEQETAEPAAEPQIEAPMPAAAAVEPAVLPQDAPAGAEQQEIEVRLPDIGDFSDVPVIEVLVGPGDSVTVDQSILTLESDKATMEIPSQAAGTVHSVAVKVGDKLNQGDLLMTLLGSAGQAAQGEPAHDTGVAPSSEESEQAQGPAAIPKPEAAERPPGEAERRKAPVLSRPEDIATIARGRTPHASPAVRRFARELGVDLGRVKGSGRKDRVLKDDVQDRKSVV